ncbi:MAG: porin family protein [Desulfohalobiaceae bacterium]
MRAIPYLTLAAVLALTFLFLFPGSACSQTNAEDGQSLFHGVYAGGAVGYASFDTDLEANGDSKEGVSASDLSTGIFAGTGTVYNRFYYGLEGNFILNNADFSENITNSETEIDISDGEFEESYGLSARLGNLLAENVLAYGLIGWQQVKLDASNNEGWSEDEKFDGLRLGAGVEYQSNQNVFIRGEYSHTFYGDEELNGIDVEPEQGHFQMGIGFRF